MNPAIDPECDREFLDEDNNIGNLPREEPEYHAYDCYITNPEHLDWKHSTL